MPTEDSPFLMVVALLSTVRGLHQYIHHQGTKRLSDFCYFNSSFLSNKLGVHARLSKCWRGTWSGKGWEPLLAKKLNNVIFHLTRHWLALANQWLEVTRQFLWFESDSKSFRWLWLEGLVTEKYDSGTSLESRHGGLQTPAIFHLSLALCDSC